MSEAVHEVAHEATHHAAHAGGSHARLVGLLISVLALFLAVSEMLGKSAQTEALALNIHASDTWNFFQAKTVRQTVLRTALETARIEPPADKAAADKQMAAWQATIERWESEPSTNEGRKELMARAQAFERDRDAHLARYHAYEIASLFLQLGIVLASVTLLSSIAAFAAGSAALGAVGLVVLGGAFFDVHAITAILH
jgi:hypothetical protein